MHESTPSGAVASRDARRAWVGTAGVRTICVAIWFGLGAGGDAGYDKIRCRAGISDAFIDAEALRRRSTTAGQTGGPSTPR